METKINIQQGQIVSVCNVSWSSDLCVKALRLSNESIGEIERQIKSGIESGIPSGEWEICIPSPETGDPIPIKGLWRILYHEERDWSDYQMDDRIFDVNNMGTFAYRIAQEAMAAAFAGNKSINGMPLDEYIKNELRKEKGDDSCEFWASPETDDGFQE